MHSQDERSAPEQTPFLGETSMPCPGSPIPWTERVLQLTVFTIYLACGSTILLVFFCVHMLFALAICCFMLIWFLINVGLVPFGRSMFPYTNEPLKETLHSIRLVELLPGEFNDPLRCNILHGTWSGSDYEALSYAWDCEMTFGGIPCWIGDSYPYDYVNLNATLARALVYLRRTDEPRRIWIDALCINQQDNKEKSSQVEQMKSVYKHARCVLVWLDVDSWSRLKADSVDPAFALIQECANVSGDHIDLEASLAHNGDEATIETIKLILNLEWWERVWVIQEVASNRNAVVQCRNRTMDWDHMCAFLLRQNEQNPFNVDDEKRTWVNRVQALRRERTTDPPFGLLSLTHDFRYSLATNTRDRLYALRGLITSEEHALNFPVDYGVNEDAVWTAFTKQCLNRYRSLNVFALIDSASYDSWDSLNGHTASWTPRRYVNPIEFTQRQPGAVRQPLWMASDSSDTSGYSAAGSSKARCRTDLVDPSVIGVQGRIVDEIRVVGSEFNSLAAETQRSEAVQNWISMLNTYEVQPSMRMKDAMRWQMELDGPAGYTLNKAMAHLRRLIITRHDRCVGIVNSRARTGDFVCILLGSNVPFVLRKSDHEGPAYRHSWSCLFGGCLRAKHKNCCIREVFTVVGQAYIDGIMEYPGDIEEDIENGTFQLREFYLE